MDYVREKLDELVATDFKEIKDKLKLKRDNIKLLEGDLDKLNKKIETETKKSTKLLELLANDELKEEQFLLMNKDTLKQTIILNNKKVEIEEKIKNNNIKKEGKELTQGIFNLLNTDVKDWTNSMLRKIINKILVYDDKTINIKYKYIDC